MSDQDDRADPASGSADHPTAGKGIDGLTGWWGTVLEAPDPIALAEFYSRLLGWPVSGSGPDERALNRPGTTSYLAVQRATAYEPPVWPPQVGTQGMQSHLDLEVADVEVATAQALALGARLARHQPQPDVRVLLDPAGHPFCLYLATD